MRSVISTIFVSSLLVAAAAPAQAAFQLVYDVLGVFDDGSNDNFGKATVIHCTNLSTSAVNVRVRASNGAGNPQGNAVTKSILPGFTLTFFTHLPIAFSGNANMQTGPMLAGRVRILAETPAAIVCAADYIDAATNPPSSMIPRKMIRYPRATSGGEE